MVWPEGTFLVTVGQSSRTMCTADAIAQSSMTMVFSSVCYSQACPPVPVESFFDDCRDPKMRAKWFREFLEELWPRCKRVPEVASVKFKSVIVRCRSGTLPQREWKMKLWKQNLVTT